MAFCSSPIVLAPSQLPAPGASSMGLFHGPLPDRRLPPSVDPAGLSAARLRTVSGGAWRARAEAAEDAVPHAPVIDLRHPVRRVGMMRPDRLPPEIQQTRLPAAKLQKRSLNHDGHGALIRQGAHLQSSMGDPLRRPNANLDARNSPTLKQWNPAQFSRKKTNIRESSGDSVESAEENE